MFLHSTAYTNHTSEQKPSKCGLTKKAAFCSRARDTASGYHIAPLYNVLRKGDECIMIHPLRMRLSHVQAEMQASGCVLISLLDVFYALVLRLLADIIFQPSSSSSALVRMMEVELNYTRMPADG
jgi:hypothetical protein